MKNKSSYHQQRLWFIDHFENGDLYEGGPIYHNIQLYFTIENKVADQDVKGAASNWLKRHEVLRTILKKEGEEIFQEVLDFETINCESYLQLKENINQEKTGLREIPFDLSGLLFKVYYEHTNGGLEVLVIIHHAIIDRYSLGILESEFRAYLQNPQKEWDAPVQYARYSNWQNNLGGSDLEPLLFFWKSKLRDIPVLYFPTDYERKQIHIYEEAAVELKFEKAPISEYCNKVNISAEALFLAAYKMALVRLTGLTDIVVGSFKNLRSEGMENLLGPLENLVLIRSDLDANRSIQELANSVNKNLIEAEDYKIMPFDKLVLEINPKKDMSRTALFDLLYAYEGEHQAQNNQQFNNQGFGKYDFNFAVKENVEDYHGIITYNKRYFRPGTANALKDAIICIVNKLLDDSSLQLNTFSLLSNTAQEKLLEIAGNNFVQDQTNSIIDVFQKNATTHPNHIALTSSQGNLTYSELDQQSSAMASWLIDEKGIQIEDRISVELTKSNELIIVLFAVMKAGAGYVP